MEWRFYTKNSKEDIGLLNNLQKNREINNINKTILGKDDTKWSESFNASKIILTAAEIKRLFYQFTTKLDEASISEAPQKIIIK